MLNRLPIASLLLLLLSGMPALAQEPDGAKPSGIPFFKAAPEPPAKLRALSHRIAWVDTRNYLYEAYAQEGSATPEAWITRYVMLPEGMEGFREAEQVFLFSADLEAKPVKLKLEDIQVDATSLRWKKKVFRLVDRRDLTTGR
jgi:hypothetical protein